MLTWQLFKRLALDWGCSFRCRPSIAASISFLRRLKECQAFGGLQRRWHITHDVFLPGLGCRKDAYPERCCFFQVLHCLEVCLLFNTIHDGVRTFPGQDLLKLCVSCQSWGRARWCHDVSNCTLALFIGGFWWRHVSDKRLILVKKERAGIGSTALRHWSFADRHPCQNLMRLRWLQTHLRLNHTTGVVVLLHWSWSEVCLTLRGQHFWRRSGPFEE